MKCPVCELFGRELNFQTRRELDQHASRFHGVTVAQLNDPARTDHPVRVEEKLEPSRSRRLLH